ncbi:hypothetical protein ACU686_16955 [Yinghuangia aomiensis]
MFSLAMVLQVGHGFTPIRPGLAVTATAIGFFAVAVYAQPLVAVLGAAVLVVGALLFGGGLAAFAAVAAHAEGSLTLPETLALLFVVGARLGPGPGAAARAGALRRSRPTGPGSQAASSPPPCRSAWPPAPRPSAPPCSRSSATTPDDGDWRTGTLTVVAVLCGLSVVTAVICARLRRVIAAR